MSFDFHLFTPHSQGYGAKPVLSANPAGEFGVDADVCDACSGQASLNKQARLALHQPKLLLAKIVILIAVVTMRVLAGSSQAQRPAQHLLHTELLSLSLFTSMLQSYVQQRLLMFLFLSHPLPL